MARKWYIIEIVEIQFQCVKAQFKSHLFFIGGLDWKVCTTLIWFTKVRQGMLTAHGHIACPSSVVLAPRVKAVESSTLTATSLHQLPSFPAPSTGNTLTNQTNLPWPCPAGLSSREGQKAADVVRTSHHSPPRVLCQTPVCTGLVS